MAIHSASTKTSTWRRWVRDRVHSNETGIRTSFTASATEGGTSFTVSSVKGSIHGDTFYTDVDFPGASNVTVSDLTETSTYVYIDRYGVLQQQTTAPTRLDWVVKVFLIRVGVDTSSNTVISFEYLHNATNHIASSIRDVYEYLREAGVSFRKGLEVTGRTDGIGFDMASGSVLEFGGTGQIHEPNTINFDAVSNVEYFKATRTNTDAGGNTDLSKNWDNNGVLTAIGSTTWVGHRVYFFSSGNVVIQYGQGNYANINLAKAGVKVEEYVTNPVLYNATFLGWWFIESTADVTAGGPDAEFVRYAFGLR